MTTATEVQHVELTRELAAPAATIFDRLIDAAHLRAWFAEHAQVEARVTGAYRFWGRHTPLMAREQDATQRLTRVDRGRALRFSWEWGGTDSDVLVELSGAGADRTRLWLRHSLVEGTVAGFSRSESRFFVEDFWGVSLGNLRSYLRTGRAALRPDFARPAGEAGKRARVSIEIDAPIERVWRALTDPAEMDKWISKAARADLRPGGAYEYGWVFEGKCCGPRTIVEIDPPRRLVHDWVYEGDSSSRTEWTLEALSAARTRVSVTQIGITRDRDHTGYTGGWAKFAMALKELVEG